MWWDCGLAIYDTLRFIEDVKKMEKLHGVMATRGHCVGNGGLRGHSVGRYFPCVIYIKGNPSQLTWWVRQPNGVDAGPHKSYEEAAMTAHSYNTGQCEDTIREVYLMKVQVNEDKATGETNCVAYCMAEEIPFDVYGLYGVTPEGLSLHLCDYDRYPAARNELARAQGLVAGGPVLYRDLLEALND